jgi:hypothetical protein
MIAISTRQALLHSVQARGIEVCTDAALLARLAPKGRNAARTRHAAGSPQPDRLGILMCEGRTWLIRDVRLGELNAAVW